VLARPYLASRKNPAIPRTDGKTNTGNSIMANIEIDWQEPPLYSAKLRDPMELDAKQQKTIIETSNDLVVKGITTSEDRKFATIGTIYVQEDEIVPGTKIRVTKINRNSVEFEEDGKTWTQEVKGEAK
jgi:type II secretory pathway component PulC